MNNFNAYIQGMYSSVDILKGMSAADFVNWFFLFSVFGYCLECVVLTFEEKKIITNRGFVHGPFCIIYGVCAVVATVILSPLVNTPMLLFFASSFLATAAELVTAQVMIRVFGAFWWDYSKKPLNYRGIISLETSIGWGFVGLFFFYFLSDFMKRIVGSIPSPFSSLIACVLTVYYIIDFGYCVYARVHGLDDDSEGVGRLKVTK